MLTRRAFSSLVLASSALPLVAWGQAPLAAPATAKLIGVFDKEVFDAFAGAQMRWVAATPLASRADYDQIRGMIVGGGPRVIIGITSAADYVIMRSMARDHGLRETECDDARARPHLADFLSKYDAMRTDADRRRCWVFAD